MIRRLRTRWERATDNEALAALLGVWNRHGYDTFALNARGPNAAALLRAREHGWTWGDGAGMHVTLAGVQALGDFLGRDLLADWVEAERIAAAEPEQWAWAEAAE
jgi:hypothetical protein